MCEKIQFTMAANIRTYDSQRDHFQLVKFAGSSRATDMAQRGDWSE